MEASVKGIVAGAGTGETTASDLAILEASVKPTVAGTDTAGATSPGLTILETPANTTVAGAGKGETWTTLSPSLPPDGCSGAADGTEP